MERIFFDTWAWIALANKRDEHHNEARDFYRDFSDRGGIPVTTDYVLAETFSALRVAVEMEECLRFGRVLMGNVGEGIVSLEFIDEERFIKTWKFHEKFNDKPGISFFDFSSIVVMEERGIREVFTGDRDFERVGMGFVLVPEKMKK